MVTGDIGQISKFQIAPNPFSWVKVWSVARQLLQVDALGSSIRQVGFDHLRAMCWNIVPNDQQQTGDHPEQLAKKVDDFSARDRMWIHLQEQATFRRDRPDE